MVLVILLGLPAVPAFAANYYVATDGDDNDDGSIGSPFETVQKGFDTIDAGDTLYLRGGTYAEHILIADGKQGDPNNWYTVKSYPGEWAILDPDHDSQTAVISAYGGYGDCPMYWLFESFEVTGGGVDNSSNSIGAGITLSTATNITFRYLYIHDNYGGTNNNSGGLIIHNDSGAGHDIKIEWCHLKDNACTDGGNCGNILLFSDYVEDPCNVNINNTLRKNEISYNLIEGSNIGIKYKNGQFLSLDHSGTHTTYNDYGDKIHHNIIRNQGAYALVACQDFTQIYNNIFELDTIPSDGVSGVTIEKGASGDREKFYVCFYNNTLIRTRLSFYRDDDGNGDGSSYILSDYGDYHPHFYCYNNIIEDIYSQFDNHNDLNILFNYGSQWSESEIDMNTVNIENNYFWPRTRTEDIINLAAPLNDYTANEYESAGHSTIVYASETSGLHTTGSDYKTDGSHVMESTTTIADGGIGGSHPYLSGITFPSYVGATDPNDDDWVDDVNDLANLGSGAPGKAGNPSPANSATNVSITADLSWTAGSGSTLCDVYFGTDSTPDSGEDQGNQTATTFDPGTMSNSTTYYWRIDEINANGTTTGDVWSFTTVSAGAPGAASSPSPANSATSVSITADLSWTAGSGATSRNVYFGTSSPGASQGNQTATTFDTGTMSNNTTYYWRIDEVNAAGTTTGTVWSFTTIVAAPSAASNPSPANSATDVSITTDLSWSAGSGATSHDVYFGTTTPGTSQGNQTATTFDTGTMDANTTYYWRIDEVNASGTTTGTVWSFTTAASSGETIKINFQPSASQVPSGYEKDYGQIYGSQGNGLSYGWSVDKTGQTRDRDIDSDQRYDTNIYWNVTGPYWEIALDNGTYDIWLVCGDAEYTNFINTLDIEGTVVTDPDGQDHFDEYNFQVEVNDGRLTIETATGASIPRLCFIEITPATVEAPGQATNPSPANTATGVSITAELSWTADANATSHDVYFGNSSPGSFQGNQTATTFDTGTMGNNTTYYWRIDEVNAGGTTTGTVWSFTTIVAAPGAASNPSPANSATNVSVTTDLSWSAGSGATSRDVYFGTSSPGASQGNQTATTFDTDTMTNNTTYYWRIDEINAAGTTTGTVWSFTTIVAAPSAASNPNPANSATDVSITTDLSWSAGSGATSHDVYFGTSSPGTSQGNQTATTFDTGTMTNNTTYYWRIDEINAGGTTTGTVWSFTTITSGQPVTEEFGDAANTDYPGTIDDTWTDAGGDGDDNYSSSTTLNTYTWPVNTVANTIIIKWDLTDISTSATVTEATLYLYQTDSDGDTSYDIGVHKITGVNPVINSLTWNTYDGTNSWTGGYDGGQGDTATAEDTQSVNNTNSEYKTWDVTDMVSDWVATPAGNYGMLVNSDDVASVDSYRYFASTEDSNTPYRPKLIVTYIAGTPGQATSPDPNDSATDVTVDADLSWTAGSGSTSSDVYFGTTSPGTFQGNQTAATFDPGTLSYDITYYWRIDEINAAGTTTGNVWSFTTEAAPQPPGQATNPSPADSATNVDVGADLSWTEGTNSTSSDVYFGTSSPGTFQGNQTATTYDPGTMANTTNGQTRDRGADSDQRYDTLNHFFTNTWEIGLDNGTYDVWLVFGDPSYTDMTNTMDIEGTVCTDPDGQDHFDEFNIQVSVNDGRLTIEPATGADNPKICFIEITSVAGPVTEEFGDAADTNYPGTIEDTWTDVGGDGDDNYSSSTTLNTYTWPVNTVANTTIIKWDLTDIPTDANVTEATLYLYQTDSDVDSSYDISVHKITGVNPGITTCTWNTYDGTNSWTGGSDGGQSDIAAAEDTQSVDDTDDEYKTWDVTNMVADWVATPANNYGMLVKSDNSASVDSYRFFASTEDNDSSVRPKLIVTYSE